MCDLYHRDKPQRRPVTHEELRTLHAACGEKDLPEKEEQRRRNRFAAKFKTAITEAPTTTELAGLQNLQICPDSLETFLKNRMAHYAANERKAAKTVRAASFGPPMATAR